MERICQTGTDKPETTQNDPKTLAEMLFYLPDPEKRQELEKYRIKYEAVHGKTDLTKRYTSVWPIEEQEWLMEHEPKRYFDGWPPFVKAYYRGKMEIAAREGRLDDKSDKMIMLFVSGQMRPDEEGRSL